MDESLSAQEAEYEETEVSTPSTIRERQGSRSRRKRSSRAIPPVEEDHTKNLLQIVSGIGQQIDAQRCPHTLFAQSLVPLLKEVKPERYFDMRMAVQHCIHSFASKESPLTPNYRPMHSAPSFAPNPYPSSFHESPSIYEPTRSQIPYPIPSPIPSVISPPNRTSNVRPFAVTSSYFPPSSKPPQLYTGPLRQYPSTQHKTMELTPPSSATATALQHDCSNLDPSPPTFFNL